VAKYEVDRNPERGALEVPLKLGGYAIGHWDRAA
jgi:hypothetical protein